MNEEYFGVKNPEKNNEAKQNKEKHKKGYRKNFNGWQVNAMHEMLKKGVSCRQVAKKFNCSGNTIKYLTDEAFKKRRHEYSKRYHQRIQEMKKQIELPAVEEVGVKEAWIGINKMVNKIVENRILKVIEKEVDAKFNKLVEEFLKYLEKKYIKKEVQNENIHNKDI